MLKNNEWNRKRTKSKQHKRLPQMTVNHAAPKETKATKTAFYRIKQKQHERYE
jgi:hypothetical protein